MSKKGFWNRFRWKSEMTHVQWGWIKPYLLDMKWMSKCQKPAPRSKLYKYLTSDRYFLWWATRLQHNKNVIEMCPTFLMGHYCWTCCSIVHPYVLNWGFRDIRRWSLNPRKCKHWNTSRFKCSETKGMRKKMSWTMIVLFKIQYYRASKISKLGCQCLFWHNFALVF